MKHYNVFFEEKKMMNLIRKKTQKSWDGCPKNATHSQSLATGEKRAKNPKRDDNRNKKKVPHIKDGHKKRRWPTQPQKRKPQYTKKRTIKKNMKWKKNIASIFNQIKP